MRVTNNPIFVENLCDVWWTRIYYIKSQKLLNNPPEQTYSNIEIEIQRPKKSQKMLTVTEKYRKASIQTAKLAKLFKNKDFLIEKIPLDNSVENDNDIETVKTGCSMDQKVANVNVKLLKKVKCPGRPKGAALTSIGLFKKRAISNPTAFEKDIEWYHEIICNGIMEEDVDIHIIRPYCTKDEWKAILNVIKAKNKHITWIYPVCNHDIVSECVLCDSCLCSKPKAILKIHKVLIKVILSAEIVLDHTSFLLNWR
ncbi:hypothetical protein QTP88_022770 [Uroleucon formosanum]